jgi:hypothetical protein
MQKKSSFAVVPFGSGAQFICPVRVLSRVRCVAEAARIPDEACRT